MIYEVINKLCENVYSATRKISFSPVCKEERAVVVVVLCCVWRRIMSCGNEQHACKKCAKLSIGGPGCRCICIRFTGRPGCVLCVLCLCVPRHVLD